MAKDGSFFRFPFAPIFYVPLTKDRILAPFLVIGLMGCDANSGGGMDPALLLGHNAVIGQNGPVTSGQGHSPSSTSSPQSPLGESCQSADSSRICLALKYVAYVNPETQQPIVNQARALANVHAVNQVWQQCGVRFQVERYLAIDPADYGLNYSTASYAELDRVRAAFIDNGEMLVVTTGTWDRSGTLGDTAANAWTAMPGSSIHGTVLEQPVSGFANLVAHELGHYMNLLHVVNDADLMNPIIYSNSNSLDLGQCGAVRSAIAFFWPQMYR